MKNLKQLPSCGFAAACFALLAFSVPRAAAWNGTGHMVTAAIAYDNLSPKTKAAVTALLKTHRDYPLWMREKPAGYTDSARWAFMKASVWPDDVRKTPDDRPVWHYVDLPVAAPGYTLSPAQKVVPTPNAQTQILAETALLTDKRTAAGDRAAALCWVEHLIGDIHQPLHTATLFSAQFPRGDRGGNNESLAAGSVDGDPAELAANPHKLHALWDDLFGATRDPAQIDKIAAPIETANYARGTQIQYTVRRDLLGWIQESNALVQPYVYLQETLPMTPTGPEAADVTLPPGYLATAHRIADRQAARAGLRLAGTLNTQAW